MFKPDCEKMIPSSPLSIPLLRGLEEYHIACLILTSSLSKTVVFSKIA